MGFVGFPSLSSEFFFGFLLFLFLQTLLDLCHLLLFFSFVISLLTSLFTFLCTFLVSFFTFVYLCFTFSSSIIAVLSCFASLFLSNQKAKHYLRVSQCYDDETYTAVVVEILLCIFAFAHYYME